MLRLAEPRFGEEDLALVSEVLASGHVAQGPRVEEFEQTVADYCGVGYAVATTSATTALHATLVALDIGPGDEVLVADFTYPATGNVVLQQDAKLRLLDIDPATYTVDPAGLEMALTPQTKLVITVDVFGLPADYARIEQLLAERGIPLLADAACSLGASEGGRRCGSIGAAACFSFHGRKVLTTGEGGMVLTDNEELARRLRRVRNHGSERDGWRSRFVEAGFNYRMSDIHAAIGLAQWRRLEELLAARQRLAETMTRLLAKVDGIVSPHVPVNRTHAFQAYVARLDPSIDRDAVVELLRGRGVEATLGTYAMHAEPTFVAACGTRPGDLPNSYAAMRETLALPMHPGLDERDAEHVAEAVADAVDRAGGGG